jgi:hypothetical protein
VGAGLRAHRPPLDVEHVAVLVSGQYSQPVSAWRAVYWYTAVHENTLCDRSAAGWASALGTEDSGIDGWISHGKHASFLSPARCEKGCGQDRCSEAFALDQPRIVNIGEPGAPLNGAVWIGSCEWPFLEKMGTAFSDGLLARLAHAESVVQVRGSRQQLQPVISAGGTSLDAAARGNNQTSAAVSPRGPALIVRWALVRAA